MAKVTRKLLVVEVVEGDWDLTGKYISAHPLPRAEELGRVALNRAVHRGLLDRRKIIRPDEWDIGQTILDAITKGAK